MNLLERATCTVLGRRLDPPAGLPAGALPEGIVLRANRWIPRIGGWLGRMGAPAAAVTLGRTVVVYPGARLTRALLAHELTHVRQWQADRWFPLRYTLATLRHGYHDNPYEVEARQVAAASVPELPHPEHS